MHAQRLLKLAKNFLKPKLSTIPYLVYVAACMRTGWKQSGRCRNRHKF